MDRLRVGIVIPALNEAASIESVVEGCLHAGIPIVVDDHSSDVTGDVARRAGATVVRHAERMGYDGALASGFRCAAELQCECIVTLDADGQHDPLLVAAFVSAIDAGADLVAGVRDRRQRFGEHVFSLVGRARWGIVDPLCGIKAYRMSLYKELGHFDSYKSIGTELALFAANRGKRVRQLPVKTRSRDGRPRFGGGMIANGRILRSLFIALRRF